MQHCHFCGHTHDLIEEDIRTWNGSTSYVNGCRDTIACMRRQEANLAAGRWPHISQEMDAEIANEMEKHGFFVKK